MVPWPRPLKAHHPPSTIYVFVAPLRLSLRLCVAAVAFPRERPRNKKGGRSNRSPLKGTGAQVEEVRYSPAAPLQRFAARVGRPRDRRRSSVVARRPCAFASIASDHRPVVRRRSLALAGFRCPSKRSPSDAHPLARHGSRRRHCDRSRALRRHVLATALLRRINRRTQSTTSATRNHTSGPTCRLPDVRHSVSRRCGPGSLGRAPLLRFRPLQRSLAMLALSGAAGLRTIPLRRFIPIRRPALLLRLRNSCLPARMT